MIRSTLRRKVVCMPASSPCAADSAATKSVVAALERYTLLLLPLRE